MNVEFEKSVIKALTLVFNGEIESVIKQLSEKAYLVEVLKKHHSKVNINATFEFDENYVKSLSNTQLSNLIKLYTLFETSFYNRHSATAIPYLLDLLSMRNFEGYEELVNWAIKTANSENPYIPFGKLKYVSCKNLNEHKGLTA